MQPVQNWWYWGMTKKVVVTPTNPQNLTEDLVIKSLQDLVGERFPMRVAVVDGRVTLFEYDDEWDEGTTIPILGKDVSDVPEKDLMGVAVIDGREVKEFKKDYTRKKLTEAQKIEIEKWVKERV